MTTAAGRKLNAVATSTHSQSAPTSQVVPAYETTFLQALEPALPFIARYNIRVVVNAGRSDVRGLQRVVNAMVKRRQLDLKVARVEGDDVLEVVKKARDNEESTFENIYTKETLREWKFEPIAAQCYLGGLGIAKALEKGAEIVLCGRVSDASPIIGAAFWWHGWSRSDIGPLANALVAGHLLECSTYVTGGNFTGFKELQAKGWDDIGYPIGEISKDGQVIMTKQKGSGGEISVATCSAQLLYEIQGPWYFNSDVTAVLEKVWFEQLSVDRVAVHGVQAMLPPPTTKVGITAKGGFQAEVHWFFVGLDVPQKAQMIEAQVRLALEPYRHRFSLLRFTLTGTSLEDPQDQNSATVDFRIFAQTRSEEDLSPLKFFRPIADQIMQGYPGATFHMDFRQAFPKEVFEYYVTLLPQSKVHHAVHHHDGSISEIDPPTITKLFPAQQPSEATTRAPAHLESFGKTTRGPLGWIVHARSGDKGSDANVGFWVRYQDEYEWLRTLLSVERVKTLLAKEYKQGQKIDRFELPNMRAVHFLLHNHLDRGVSCTSSYDFLGKNVAEFLRARHVDIPTSFLSRAKI